MEQIKTHWQTLPMESSMSQADFLYQLIEEAEAIVIGIGAGMSAATGFTYVGKRFTDAFPDFIAKYRFFDMLQASLFDFEDEQEYWAFQSRVSLLNCFVPPVWPACGGVRHTMTDINYPATATDADKVWYAANFDIESLFRRQGEYRLWQCSNHWH